MLIILLVTLAYQMSVNYVIVTLAYQMSVNYFIVTLAYQMSDNYFIVTLAYQMSVNYFIVTLAYQMSDHYTRCKYFDLSYARATVVRARFLAAAFSDGSYLAHVNGHSHVISVGWHDAVHPVVDMSSLYAGMM